MSAVSPKESVKSQSRYQLIYALCPLTLKWGTNHSQILQTHELLVIEQPSPLQEMTIHVFTPSVWEQPVAIWTGLQ